MHNLSTFSGDASEGLELNLKFPEDIGTEKGRGLRVKGLEIRVKSSAAGVQGLGLRV